MKKSTKIAMGIGTGVAFLTASIISALAGKKKADGNDDCIEADYEDVTDSEESTDEVED